MNAELQIKMEQMKLLIAEENRAAENAKNLTQSVTKIEEISSAEAAVAKEEIESKLKEVESILNDEQKERECKPEEVDVCDDVTEIGKTRVKVEDDDNNICYEAALEYIKVTISALLFYFADKLLKCRGWVAQRESVSFVIFFALKDRSSQGPTSSVEDRSLRSRRGLYFSVANFSNFEFLH